MPVSITNPKFKNCMAQMAEKYGVKFEYKPNKIVPLNQVLLDMHKLLTVEVKPVCLHSR